MGKFKVCLLFLFGKHRGLPTTLHGKHLEFSDSLYHYFLLVYYITTRYLIGFYSALIAAIVDVCCPNILQLHPTNYDLSGKILGLSTFLDGKRYGLFAPLYDKLDYTWKAFGTLFIEKI
jgi:hypothetical protein